MMIWLRSFWTSHEADQVLLLLRTTQLFINKTFKYLLHSHLLKDTFISIKSLIRTFEASIIHPPTYSRKFTVKTFFPWSVGLRQTGRKYNKRQNVSVSKAKTTADRTCHVGFKVWEIYESWPQSCEEIAEKLKCDCHVRISIPTPIQTRVESH